MKTTRMLIDEDFRQDECQDTKGISKIMRFILFVFFYFIGMTSAYADTSGGVPDTMAERVKPCTFCHGAEDTAGRDTYYPRIAGKPQGYLYNQLRNFRDGRRHYQPMAILLENMSDDYLQAIAHYFSSLQLPYPAPEPIHMQPEEIRPAERLVYSGSPGKDMPACSACHGDNLMGVEPAIPGLLGLSRAYITAQLGGWRHGSAMRGQVPDCMSEIARQLTDVEVNTLAKWLASQPVSGRSGSFSRLSPELAQRCRPNRLEDGGTE